MRTVRMLSALMTIMFDLSIASCCGGGTTTVRKTQTQIINPDAAHELQDLDNAYKNGSITIQEYEKLRKDVMDKAAQTK